MLMMVLCVLLTNQIEPENQSALNGIASLYGQMEKYDLSEKFFKYVVHAHAIIATPISTIISITTHCTLITNIP